MSTTLINTRQETNNEEASWRNSKVIFGVISATLLTSFILPLPAANGHIAHIPAFCPFYLATGLPCPGCGLTRAFVCISHGRIAESFHWHPIGLLVYLTFVALWGYYGFYALKRVPPYVVPPKIKRILGCGAAITLFGTGFIRIVWILTTHHNPF